MKSNAERQLDIQKELCKLADKIRDAHAEDQAFYIEIAQQYVLHLKEIQKECYKQNGEPCIDITPRCDS